MITINSLSGGKTSSYMAMHHKADYNLFAVVMIEAQYCRPKDESIVKYASDKLGVDFIATAESDKTLILMRDLEQMIGRDITWVSGDTFEATCAKKRAVPNVIWRFCTTEMKMKPMFEWWKRTIGNPIMMNIGFRYDEKERANKENTKFKTIIGKMANGKNRWGEIYWREPNYPLIDSKITNWQVSIWAKNTNLIFPPDSNCVGCFHKPFQQLRKNWDDEPMKMR